MVIDSFKTKEGNREVKLGKLTVFVGPNNCGKSQTLKDISAKMNNRLQSKIISDIKYSDTEYSRLESFINISDHETALNHKTIRGISENFSETEFAISNPEFDSSKIISDKLFNFYNKFRVILLNSQNRTNMIQTVSTNGMEKDRASNLLQLAYLDDKKEIITEFKKIFKETFHVSIYLDHTSLSQISLKISEIEITSLTGDTQNDRRFLKDLEKVDDQGEGYKSFAATVLGLIAAKNRLVLLDEPEVFLHNAQQRQLGRWVGNFMKSEDMQLIIATHISNFLEGLLASRVDVNIQRLNRNGNNTFFSNIESDIVKQLTTDPILSSQRVLDAVFQKAVVICEADADRLIYKMVADKIKPSHEILFTHSHNKQTTPTIVKALKNCTVPVFSILDIDIFHENKEYEKILDAHKINLESEYIDIRSRLAKYINDNKDDQCIKKELKEELERLLVVCNEGVDIPVLKSKVGNLKKIFLNWDRFKKQGVEYIADTTTKEELINLINRLEKNNLYIVQVGELEGWLPEKHPKGRAWINYAVEAINNKLPEKLKSFIESIINN